MQERSRNGFTNFIFNTRLLASAGNVAKDLAYLIILVYC